MSCGIGLTGFSGRSACFSLNEKVSQFVEPHSFPLKSENNNIYVTINTCIMINVNQILFKDWYDNDGNNSTNRNLFSEIPHPPGLYTV